MLFLLVMCERKHQNCVKFYSEKCESATLQRGYCSMGKSGPLLRIKTILRYYRVVGIRYSSIPMKELMLAAFFLHCNIAIFNVVEREPILTVYCEQKQKPLIISISSV